jgi:lipoprotein-releasing system permease protein
MMRWSFVATVGCRYGISRGKNQLVSFISRLSTMGLVVGVALLILVLSIMNGFDKELRENILGVMPQATVLHRQSLDNPNELIEIVTSHPQVQAATPFVQLPGLLSRRNDVAPVQIFGIDPAREGQTSTLPKYLGDDVLIQLSSSANAIILGRGVAEKLAVTVGEGLSLIVPVDGAAPKIFIVNVIGILDTRTDVDNGLAIMELSAAAKVAGFEGHVTGVRLKVDDLFAAQQIIRDVMQRLPPEYYGSSWMRTHGSVYQSIQMSKSMVGMLLFLVIAIAAFNLVSTLIMVVVDKQGDIAIMRTMGASSAEIMGIFMVQGGLIGLMGALMGLVLGVVLSYFATPFAAGLEAMLGMQFLHSDVYPTNYLPSQILWGDVFKVVSTAVLLSLVVTLYPAWRATRVAPADALRYE